MKQSHEFENILDDCLERLINGETVERCLESYPEQASELEPLLCTAQATRGAAAIQPRSEFRARARYEFRSALEAQASQKPSLFHLRRRWAVALLVISILLVSGGGTALAASRSMPDSPLYSVKLATEETP
jgi:anti-sigma-K factor RskA